MRYKELLKMFETIVSSTSTNKKHELEVLSNTASSDLILNARQRDGIMSRCSGFVAGIAYSFIEEGKFKSYNL